MHTSHLHVRIPAALMVDGCLPYIKKGDETWQGRHVVQLVGMLGYVMYLRTFVCEILQHPLCLFHPQSAVHRQHPRLNNEKPMLIIGELGFTCKMCRRE